MSGLKDLRYEEPTPIQEKCIPLILDEKDVIGAAQTGTGKTGAFVIPILQKILSNKTGQTQALILSPTRELAQQIEEQIFALGYHTGITSATVTGGSDYGTQVKAIRAGVDVLVATPGRLIDQMKVLDIDFKHLNYLVLDEADRMLDMGFLPDVMKIVKQLPEKRQTMLFSATMADEIQEVVNRVMKDNPAEVEIEVSKPADSVDQQVYFVHPKKKLELFEQLFDENKYKTAIIFTATKRGTDQLERMLKKRNVSAVSMHGDRDQEERNEALRLFKNKTHPVMVATDVLSRGIDIDDVSLIVNFDVPNNPEDYIHRIGRTGRYDKEGTAITFVSNKEKKYFYAIKKAVGDQLTIKEYPGKTENKQEPKPKKQDDLTENKKSAKKPERPSSRKKKQKSSKSNNRNGAPKSKGKGKKSRGNKKSTRHKKSNNHENNHRSGRSGRSGRRGRIPNHLVEKEEDIYQPEIIEKAVARNRRSLKPAKGVWGIIKSFLPKF
jgi:superfamily II DNA/RNA helicase